MAGIKDGNLRSGYIHEELGLLLLRPVALVASVPQWEDAGLDAVATLLRPEGGRRLIPEDTFGVQLKASSVRVIFYEDTDAARWLVRLGLPLFIGSVRVKGAAIDLYPVHALFKVLPHNGLREVHLHLDAHPEQLGSPEVAHVYVGPPALSWSTNELADREFPVRAYPVLKGHIGAAHRNIQGRVMGYSESVVWQPGQLPAHSGAFMLQKSQCQDFSKTLASLITPIRALIMDMEHPDRIIHLPGVFEFVKAMRALGTDLDPEDGLVKMAVGCGPPDDLRRKILGRLLGQGMSPARFWWQGQLGEPLEWSSDPDKGAPGPP
jgi:hypothetical protein